MITRKEAQELVNKYNETVKAQREKIVSTMCEKEVHDKVMKAAEEGKTEVVIKNINPAYEKDIANYLRANGGFAVRIDSINNSSSSLVISWNS
jgi:hypothetical protein